MTTREASGRRRLNLGDDGVGLVELIVTIAVFAILMTMIVSIFSSFSQTFSNERAQSDSINVAGVGMNELTKVIRAGTIIDLKSTEDRPIFVEAQDESVTLYSYVADNSLDPRPIRVKFSIDADRQLLESVWKADPSPEGWVFKVDTVPSTAPDSTRIIARKIIARTNAEVAAGKARLFTYIDSAGNKVATPVTAGAPARGLIAAVVVTMNVQADDTNQAPPVELRTRVGLPNLSTSRLGLNG